MNLFPESDEKDNSYETEEDQLKDTHAYGRVGVFLLIIAIITFLFL